MSEENAERLRAGYELFNETGELPWDLLSPDIEYTNLMPDTSVMRGRDAVQTAMRDWTAAFDDFRQTIEEMVVDEDRVVAMVRQTGVIKGSTDKVSHVVAHFWTFHGGKAVRMVTLGSKEAALEAAGLLE